MEEGVVEQSAVEKEISEKAKEWIEEYGEDFLVDLIDVYLEDTPNRIAQMRESVDGSGDHFHELFSLLCHVALEQGFE